MVKNWLKNGSQLLTRRQASILSAAFVIMVMIAVSRVLGLARNRILAHFFSVDTLALYFAAFRIPEVIFEVLVFGTLSSAFIPTFTAYFSRSEKKQAWHVANASLNIALVIFSLLGMILFGIMPYIYRLIAAGFTPEQLDQVVILARILLLAQGFFVISYFLTGILESLQRFLIPAIAPLFYNLGIIFGTILLAPKFGIFAPVVGAVFGAFGHFIIQLPVVFHLGFRPRRNFDYTHPGVRKVGKLALPRIIELSFLQVGKSVELFLASLISTAAYTYFMFANSLQLLPVGLFGVSIAKASLPTLSRQAVRQDWDSYRKTFVSSFLEVIFLVVPLAVLLAILRIPIVRLTFGAARFTWASTVETGRTLSAFSIGIFAQALIYLLARAFYAVADTSTPVKVSIGSILANALLSSFFVLGLRLPVWSLALSFSLVSIIQVLVLIYLLSRKVKGLAVRILLPPIVKISIAAATSGGVMFFLLKIFDRSVWDKNLSFLGRFGLTLPTSFHNFVLDTRYTANLIYLTGLVTLIGTAVYLSVAWLLRIKELAVFSRLYQKLKLRIPSVPKARSPKEKEAITVESDQSQSI
jgi:putative peptidoglycan lipid II flippase